MLSVSLLTCTSDGSVAVSEAYRSTSKTLVPMHKDAVLNRGFQEDPLLSATR